MPQITRNHPKLTLEGAKAILAAAEIRATEIGVPMNIAVVDDGGHLLAFSRMDGAKLSSVRIAITKALGSAIRTRLPTGPSGGDPSERLPRSASPSPVARRKLRCAAACQFSWTGNASAQSESATEARSRNVDVAQTGVAALNTR